MEGIAENTASTDTGAVPDLDSSSITDEQLAAIFPGETPKAQAAVLDKPAIEKTPAVEAPKVPAAEETSGLDEATLDAWEKPEAPKDAAPAPDYVADLVRVLPNRESASFAIDAFQRQNAFNQAVQSGNDAQAVEALPAVRTLVQRAITAHVRQNEEAIVQAWIDRNSPDRQDPKVATLEQELQHIKAYLQSGVQQQKTKQDADDIRSRHDAIDKAIPSMLDKIRFTKDAEDRDVVADFFRIELSKDSAAFQKALKNDLTAMQPAFSRAVKRFIAFDKKKTPPAPTNKETTPIVNKGGIQTSDDVDEFALAEQWMQSHR